MQVQFLEKQNGESVGFFSFSAHAWRSYRRASYCESCYFSRHSHFTPHTSHLTPHTSHLTPHTRISPLVCVGGREAVVLRSGARLR